MSTRAVPLFSKRFELAKDVLAHGSAVWVEVADSADADVVAAIQTNQPFPTRPDGRIELARVALVADAGQNVAFNAGPARVSLRGSGGAQASVGIYDRAADAVAALGLEESPGIDPSPADGSARFLLLRCGYQAEGAASGAHPLGALGSVTFGAKGRSEAVFAVLHRFAPETGAHDALGDAVRSWRLPRQVRTPDDLAPGAWLLAEAEGSLAVKVAAQLGYDFNSVWDARVGGLTGDIGLKLDAAVKATLALDVSGRYLLALGRESADETNPRVRLRIFKLSKNGMAFGLNLSAGVAGRPGILPDRVDDFVKAVFGVHGVQVLTSLRAVEKWTDPKRDVSEVAAGFVNDKALELLREATGVDPEAAFDIARKKLLALLRDWDELPAALSSLLWRELPAFVGDVKVRSALAMLASADPEKQREALRNALAATRFDESLAGRWLMSLAERGALALFGELDDVRRSAQLTLRLLDGGLLANLQGYLEKRLDLDKLRKVAAASDFDQLDSLLVKRLSLFFDEELGFEDLDRVKDAVNRVVAMRQTLYEKGRTALAKRYQVDFAATYQATRAATALLDAEFDLTEAGGRALFTEVLERGNMDRLLMEAVPGVSIREAVLSHELTRLSSVQLDMPGLRFRRDHATRSLAKVQVEEDNGRILVYQLDASDEVSERNKYRSRLSVALSYAAKGDAVRVHSRDRSTWSYSMLYAKENMKREELDSLTRPFIEQYLPEQFASSDLSAWYTNFDRTVEELVGNGPNEFGDVLAAMEVTAPGAALAAWLAPRTKDLAKEALPAVSCAIQSGLKWLLPFYYFQDVSRLRQSGDAAALLVWAAMRPSTGNDGVYWNHPDRERRRAMALGADTAARLAPALMAARRRLQEAGDQRSADFFRPEEAADFQRLAAGSADELFRSLCLFESEVVRGAADALMALSETGGGSPAAAIERLAEFGARITRTFHDKLGGTVYAKGASPLRSLGPMVFLEASRALDPRLRAERPSAMLALTVLKERRQFRLPDFLDGKHPEPEDIAVSQRLVSVEFGG